MEICEIDSSPIELFEFIQICNNFAEISILYENHPTKFHLAYCIFIDFELSRLSENSKKRMYFAFQTLKKENDLSKYNEMSKKLSKRISELFIQNFK